MAKPTLLKIYSFTYHGLSILFALFIIYYNSPGSSLFSWHPITTSIAVSILMSQGIVIFDPAFSIFSPAEKKQTTVNRHLIIQAISAVLIVVGFVIIFLNKYLKSKNHFMTWHAWLGLATTILVPLVVAGGVASNYGARISNLLRPYQVKWAHGLAGMLLYTAAVATMGLGLFSNWAIRNVEAPQKIIMAVILCLLLVMAWERARSRFLMKIIPVPTAGPATTASAQRNVKNK